MGILQSDRKKETKCRITCPACLSCNRHQIVEYGLHSHRFALNSRINRLTNVWLSLSVVSSLDLYYTNRFSIDVKGTLRYTFERVQFWAC